MKKILTKPVASQYSFYGRYNTRQDAREVAKKLCSEEKHAYYTQIREKGNDYWDVRTEN